MKTESIARKDNWAATFSLVRRLLLCIVFSHALWCEAQQTVLRQKPKTAPRQFGSPTAPQQAPNQIAPQQGANQTGTQASAAPVAGDITRPGAAPTSAQKQLVPGKTNNVVFSDLMGGRVFSSGTEDIHVRILPHSSGPHPLNQKLWTDARTTIPSSIYLVSPGPERFIGNNIPGDVTVNLGKISKGEMIFAIKTYDGCTFQNGGADRNPDQVVHAFTRTFALGPVQVWFEDSAVNGNRRDNDMDDVAIQLSGGVRGSGRWAELQKAVDEQAAGKQAANKGAGNAPNISQKETERTKN